MNRKTTVIVIVFSILLLVLYLILGLRSDSPKVVKLWEDGNLPKHSEPREKNWIDNISESEIRIYSPKLDENKGAAVLICPGGSYVGLAIKDEGTLFAQWLSQQGITGVVLKYRIPRKQKEVPMEDVTEAMKYLHAHASELGIEPKRIGIAGFSAGGHLAATASTHMLGELRPDFAMLFYPVISMRDSITHHGSRRHLLGDNPSEEDIAAYSCDEQVDENTPPTIVLVSDDDKGVFPANSIAYYDALKKHNIPAEIHTFAEGDHGWGMSKDFKYHKEMLDLLSAWLKNK